MKQPTPAPLFTDAFTFCEWLLGRLGTEPSVLARRMCRTALDLLEAIVFALKGRQRTRHLSRADAHITVLRTYLRLAASLGEHLSEPQSLHGLSLLDGMGRQIGGWQRHLLEAS